MYQNEQGGELQEGKRLFPDWTASQVVFTYMGSFIILTLSAWVLWLKGTEVAMATWQTSNNVTIHKHLEAAIL